MIYKLQLNIYLYYCNTDKYVALANFFVAELY